MKFPRTGRNLNTQSIFSSSKVHSVYHGTKLLSFRGPKISELITEDTKQSERFKNYSKKSKSWYLQDVLVDYAVFIFKTYVSSK